MLDLLVDEEELHRRLDRIVADCGPAGSELQAVRTALGAVVGTLEGLAEHLEEVLDGQNNLSLIAQVLADRLEGVADRLDELDVLERLARHPCAGRA